MALVKGVNCGFVIIVPTDDPNGTNVSIDAISRGLVDTAPTGATKVTEIGWYCDNATEEANFEVGIYENVVGANLPYFSGDWPEHIISKDDTNAKGTTAGWKKVTGLNISITAGTKYWIVLQLDNTTTTTNSNYSVTESHIGCARNDSTLNDPYLKSAATTDPNGNPSILGIYALTDAGNMTVADDFNNGPLADLGVTVSRTPVTVTTNFSGQKTYTDGSAAGITAIFVNPSKNFALDKSGLTEVFDAKLIVASTQTINKHDKINYDSKTYRVDKVNNRIREGTIAFKSVILFFID